VNLDTGEQSPPEQYWSAEGVVEQGYRNPSQISEAAAVEQLDRLLRDAIKLRMVSDVPLGAFLSGGIDSSLVVALMQAQSASPVKTFTIGFSEAQYDEAIYARKVARHLGTEHRELYVTPSAALNVIPRLPSMYDEPFADSSQIPTFLVSQLARRAVTVCLSGDGGDELFGGYERYNKCEQIWSRIGFLPLTARRLLAAGMRIASPASLDRVIGWALPKVGRWGRPKTFGEAIHKAAEVLAEPGPSNLYHQLVSHWKRPAQVVVGATEPATLFGKPTGKFELAEWMMYMDTVTYLPDDILVKLDRATMAVGLESRVPLLDPHLMQFAWQLPMRMKRRGGANKWILKQVLRQYMPDELVNRPKMGFGIPLGQWLRGPLRDWAEELLDERRLRTENIFHPAPIRKKWEEHVAGTANWQYHLWDVLMFQAWFETTKEGSQARCASTELSEVL
jgi:asparagine synthase (glutamine-hydrolysing)